MSKKSVLESCDNVNHKEYIDYIFSFSLYDMWADDIRWLKKFEYIPIDECVVCGKKVFQRSCICYHCKEKDKKIESLEVKKYIKKNKRLD